MTSANLNQAIAPLDNDDEDENATASLFQLVTSVPPSATDFVSPVTTMSEDKSKKSKEKQATEPSIFYQHMTTAAHACILLFVILIIYLCFSDEFVFFTWHPLLLSFGWMFLMTVAVLTLSKDNLFTGTLPKKVRVRLHWIFLTVAIVLILSGFGVVFINKNSLNKTHFKTWHALFGLIGIICSIPTCLDGILALYHGALRHYMSPRYNKLLHFASGVATLLFGGLALILSVYTNWFARRTNENILTFILGLVFAVVAVTWPLVVPVTKCFSLLKSVIKRD